MGKKDIGCLAIHRVLPWVPLNLLIRVSPNEKIGIGKSSYGK